MVVKTRKVLEKKNVSSKTALAVGVPVAKKKKSTPKKESGVKKIQISAKKPQQVTKTRIKLKETSRTTQTKVSITDNTKRPVELAQRVSIYPLVQSPFRFPLPSPRAVSILARSFGMVFVLVGALFSMMHLSENVHTASYNALSNFANVIDYSLDTKSESLDGGVNQLSGPDALVNTKPEAHITTERGGEVASGIYISVTVPSALEVKVLLVNNTNGQFYVLGNALTVDPSTWKSYWDTAKYPAGEYTIKLLIKNAYGTYEHVGSSSITVEDLHIGESALNSVHEEVQATEQAFTLSVSEDNPVNGSVTFDVKAQNATSMRITLENSQSGTLYSVGALSKKSADQWGIAWNSALVPDGTYTVRFRILFEDGTQILNVDRKLIVGNKAHDDTVAPETEDLIPEKTEPTATIILDDEGELDGFVGVGITTTPTEKVELFIMSINALTPQFIGLAQKMSETDWKFSWQTENSPNGEYYIFARLKSAYGSVDAGKRRVVIANTSMTEFSDEQLKAMETLHDINNELIKVTEEDITDDDTGTIEYVEPVSKFVEIIDVEEEVRTDMEQLLTAFRIKLNERLSELARAKREGNDADLRRIEADIETLRNEVLQTLPKGIEKKELIQEISTYLSQVTFELSEITIKNETLLRERIGDAVTNDSDKDDVSDYDEINLYKTNPFSADSDNDGYNDNVELVSGFDPLDSTAEAVVAYESPKEVGIVRDDLLVVESVTPIEKVNEDEQPKGLISGKALPNSFVTLYIYSTPVVVTVKTDSEGNWNYIFDKELEDGEHEVYVGITNNQGKIVAKSNPLPFVKTAEAFAGAAPEASAVTIAEAEPSLVNTDSLLTIASMIVLILGIVLLFLGFHLKKEDVIIEQPLAV